MTAVADEILEIELDGPANENPVFRPLQRRLRGRFDLMRVAEPQAKLMLEKIPKPIPGQRLGINLAKREAYLLEPLHLPEHEEIRQKVTCDASGARKYNLSEPREVFPNVDLATWLFWMAAEVKAGTARVTIGKLPEKITGKVQRGFYSQRDDRDDSVAGAIKEMTAAMAANTAVMAELLKKIPQAK